MLFFLAQLFAIVSLYRYVYVWCVVAVGQHPSSRLPCVERPINLDRNREALESGGKYLHGVIGQGDLENPDENWVLVGSHGLVAARTKKKTFNSLQCCC